MKVIKKDIPQTCWVCHGKKCKVCHYTGVWKERIYHMIVKDKNGKEYCYDMDTIK